MKMKNELKDKKVKKKNLLLYLYEGHKFFVSISPDFMEGVCRRYYYTNYPKAYIRFMYDTYKYYTNVYSKRK